MNKVKTSVKGVTRVYPKSLEELNQTYTGRIKTVFALNRLAQTIDGYEYIEKNPEVENYRWLCALYFRKEGEMAILFPWHQFDKQSNKYKSERQIRIYSTGKIDSSYINKTIRNLTNLL